MFVSYNAHITYVSPVWLLCGILLFSIGWHWWQVTYFFVSFISVATGCHVELIVISTFLRKLLDTFPLITCFKFFQFIIIPCFSLSFEHNDGDKLIGSPPAPDAENSENIISTFILELIEPDNPFGTSDAVRILLLQLSCLLVDQGNFYESSFFWQQKVLSRPHCI